MFIRSIVIYSLDEKIIISAKRKNDLSIDSKFVEATFKKIKQMGASHSKKIFHFRPYPAQLIGVEENRVIICSLSEPLRSEDLAALFSHIAKAQHSSDLENIIQNPPLCLITKIEAETKATKDIVAVIHTQVIERTANLDVLRDKTEDLAAHALHFKKAATHLRESESETQPLTPPVEASSASCCLFSCWPWRRKKLTDASLQREKVRERYNTPGIN